MQAIHVVRAKLSQDADTVFEERWQLYYLVGHAIGGAESYTRPDDLYALAETLRLIA